MESTWLELAGTASLFLFATVVVALLVVGAARVLSCPPRADLRDSQASRRSLRAPALHRIDRFVCEYVGNVAPEERVANGRATAPVDRRSDGAPRALLEEIIGEMDRCWVPLSERETFLEDLRDAIRSEEELRALDAGKREAERRFLQTKRWALAERFHSIVEDPPPEIVDRIKFGFRSALDGSLWGQDGDT